MCGRFTLTFFLTDVCVRFLTKQPDFDCSPRYNIAPTQVIPVVVNEDGNRLVKMRWGLIPFWAKDPSIGSKMINARAETIGEKTSFRRILQRKRCLVPADGFYEWKKVNGKKKPYRIIFTDRSLFGFAGLYDTWKSPEGTEINTFTIITTTSNKLISEVHHRMPAILTKEAEQIWLDPSVTGELSLIRILRPYPAEKMTIYEVSPLVNSPRNDNNDCIRPSSE
jgi:putative SOS response-associated peptidase YedK